MDSMSEKVRSLLTELRVELKKVDGYCPVKNGVAIGVL